MVSGSFHWPFRSHSFAYCNICVAAWPRTNTYCTATTALVFQLWPHWYTFWYYSITALVFPSLIPCWRRWHSGGILLIPLIRRGMGYCSPPTWHCVPIHSPPQISSNEWPQWHRCSRSTVCCGATCTPHVLHVYTTRHIIADKFIEWESGIVFASIRISRQRRLIS